MNAPEIITTNAQHNMFQSFMSTHHYSQSIPNVKDFIDYLTYIYIYIYIFHPRYLHNDIFRYMTLEITQDISAVISLCTAKLIVANFLKWKVGT